MFASVIKFRDITSLLKTNLGIQLALLVKKQLKTPSESDYVVVEFILVSE